jgi:hypothetical protein
MNKETIEQAAKTYRKTIPNSTFGDELGFIDGAKWHAEQNKNKYSVEDLLSAFEAGMMFIGEDKGSFREWFEQYKNK